MADEKQDSMAYVARDKCGCIVEVTARDTHLDEVALMIAGWILDGLRIETVTADVVRHEFGCKHRGGEPAAVLSKMSPRKFYRTLHLVQTVSEHDRVVQMDLDDLAYEIKEGDSVGQVWSSSDEINAVEAAKLLTEMAANLSSSSSTSTATRKTTKSRKTWSAAPVDSLAIMCRSSYRRAQFQASGSAQGAGLANATWWGESHRQHRASRPEKPNEDAP